MQSLTWTFEDGSTVIYTVNTKAEKKALVRLLKGEKPQEEVTPPSSVKKETLERNAEVAPQYEGVSLEEVQALRAFFKGEISEEAEDQLTEVLEEEIANGELLSSKKEYEVDNQYVYKLWKGYKKHASYLKSWGAKTQVGYLVMHPLLSELTWDILSLHYENLGDLYRHPIEGALKIQSFFGKNARKFLEACRQNKETDWAHDFGLELPNSKGDNQLVNLLIKWVGTNSLKIEDARNLVKFWSDFSNEVKKEISKSAKKALEFVTQKTYDVEPGFENFGVECAKHGYSKKEFEECLGIYKEGIDVPELFDSSIEFDCQGYVGKFLPRNDVRVGFFGEYTNCCQHYQGAGSECAVSSVKDAFSQLFVVENQKGEILCGSWVWMNESNQVCFDNIEAKGLNSEQAKICKEIYREVALWIHTKTGEEVSTGLGLTDLVLRGEAVFCELPQGYYGYTDAHKQISLLKKGDVSNYLKDEDEEDDDDEDYELPESEPRFCHIPRWIDVKRNRRSVVRTLFVERSDLVYGTMVAMKVPLYFHQAKFMGVPTLKVVESYPELGYLIAEDIEFELDFDDDYYDDDDAEDDYNDCPF